MLWTLSINLRFSVIIFLLVFEKSLSDIGWQRLLILVIFLTLLTFIEELLLNQRCRITNLSILHLNLVSHTLFSFMYQFILCMLQMIKLIFQFIDFFLVVLLLINMAALNVVHLSSLHRTVLIRQKLVRGRLILRRRAIFRHISGKSVRCVQV